MSFKSLALCTSKGEGSLELEEIDFSEVTLQTEEAFYSILYFISWFLLSFGLMIRLLSQSALVSTAFNEAAFKLSPVIF